MDIKEENFVIAEENNINNENVEELYLYEEYLEDLSPGPNEIQNKVKLEENGVPIEFLNIKTHNDQLTQSTQDGYNNNNNNINNNGSNYNVAYQIVEVEHNYCGLTAAISVKSETSIRNDNFNSCNLNVQEFHKRDPQQRAQHLPQNDRETSDNNRRSSDLLTSAVASTAVAEEDPFYYMSPADRAFFAKRDYECDICGGTFTIRANLNRHKKTIHPNGTIVKEVYKCPICKINFKTAGYLRRHSKVHLGNRTNKKTLEQLKSL